MNKDIPKIREIEPNPFVNEYFRVKVRVLTDSKNIIPDGTLMLPKETLLEGEPYIKVFRSAVFRDALIELKPTARKLWDWIEFGLPHGEDYIKINRDNFMSKAKVTRQAYTRAIKELTKAQFIIKSSVEYVYHINPRICFYGSRVTKYPNHLKY